MCVCCAPTPRRVHTRFSARVGTKLFWRPEEPAQGCSTRKGKRGCRQRPREPKPQERFGCQTWKYDSQLPASKTGRLEALPARTPLSRFIEKREGRWAGRPGAEVHWRRARVQMVVASHWLSVVVYHWLASCWARRKSSCLSSEVGFGGQQCGFHLWGPQMAAGGSVWSSPSGLPHPGFNEVPFIRFHKGWRVVRAWQASG